MNRVGKTKPQMDADKRRGESQLRRMTPAPKCAPAVGYLGALRTLHIISDLKNHREHRVLREKLRRSVLSVYSVVEIRLQQFFIQKKIKIFSFSALCVLCGENRIK